MRRDTTTHLLRLRDRRLDQAQRAAAQKAREVRDAETHRDHAKQAWQTYHDELPEAEQRLLANIQNRRVGREALDGYNQALGQLRRTEQNLHRDWETADAAVGQARAALAEAEARCRRAQKRRETTAEVHRRRQLQAAREEERKAETDLEDRVYRNTGVL